MTHESTSDDELRELRRQQIIDSIPEFSIVENQKENITPRRKGRSAAGLVTFGMNYEERQAQLQQGHDSFEKELEQIDELDDPLDVYVRYIDWTEEMYPQGHNQESDLIGLLQDATTRFQKSEQYKNDARYLRCWLKYTEMLEDPGEVFRLLSKENIGQMLALYYEKYAAYLESRGRLSEAEKVFSAGINREAQPLARLERSFRQFRSRLEGRRSAAPVNTAREQTRALEQTGQRTILGHKMDSRSSVSVPANVYNRMYPNASNNGNTGFGNNNSGSSTSTHPGTPKFSVYVDSPSSSSSASNPLPTFSVSSSSPSSSSSSTAITHASVISDARRRPENDPPVSKFTGTTILQRPYKRPGPPKFQVYRDDDSQDDTTKSLANGTDDDMTTNGRSLVQSRPASNFSQLTIRFRRSRSSLIRSTDSSGREEYISACLECIRGDQDTSFEELRARRRDVSMLAAMEGLPLSESKAIKEQEKERHMKEQDKKQKQTQSVEELTAETRAAMESIDAMLTKRRPTEMSLDEDDGIPWTKLPKQRKIVNENDPPTPCYTANNDIEPSQQRQDSFFSDDMGFAAGEMDEDFDELEHDMAREAEEARKRTG